MWIFLELKNPRLSNTLLGTSNLRTFSYGFVTLFGIIRLAHFIFVNVYILWTTAKLWGCFIASRLYLVLKENMIYQDTSETFFTLWNFMSFSKKLKCTQSNNSNNSNNNNSAIAAALQLTMNTLSAQFSSCFLFSSKFFTRIYSCKLLLRKALTILPCEKGFIQPKSLCGATFPWVFQVHNTGTEFTTLMFCHWKRKFNEERYCSKANLPMLSLCKDLPYRLRACHSKQQTIDT